jgi:hypothetical protein
MPKSDGFFHATVLPPSGAAGWTMWTTFHKSPQQQQKQARIFPANF